MFGCCLCGVLDDAGPPTEVSTLPDALEQTAKQCQAAAVGTTAAVAAAASKAVRTEATKDNVMLQAGDLPLKLLIGLLQGAQW